MNSNAIFELIYSILIHLPKSKIMILSANFVRDGGFKISSSGVLPSRDRCVEHSHRDGSRDGRRDMNRSGRGMKRRGRSCQRIAAGEEHNAAATTTVARRG